uniref:Membrane associated protein n=1 Tax=Angiostrongylus cantonensis TaxID=6313 RepID=A0A0K0D7B0_ANGCA
MPGILRLRQLAILGVIAVSFVFIYNGYSTRELNKELGSQQNILLKTGYFQEDEFDFKIVVSGQDIDRQYNSGSVKSKNNSVPIANLHSQ